LEKFKCEKGKEDTLDEGCDTHDKGNNVALLEKQRNLVSHISFLQHKNM